LHIEEVEEGTVLLMGEEEDEGSGTQEANPELAKQHKQ